MQSEATNLDYLQDECFQSKHGYLFHADCRQKLKDLQSQSVHLIITDPPYFIDGMDDGWNNAELQKKLCKSGVVGGRPIGMKFAKSQSYEFQRFMYPISQECYRVLKPGGFFICFSQARLYHRLACAAEDAGFEMRDMLAWNHNGQAKAFSQEHFIRKRQNLDSEQKQQILQKLNGRKTPQLKPQIEPMILAQKPKEGTFVDNWLQHEVGLVDTTQSLDGTFPGNLMPVAKPNKDEKGNNNSHLTVKPTKLLSHLIKIFSVDEQIVLDPFMGSGSTALAAIESGRHYIGIECEAEYFDIATQRIENAEKTKDSQKKLF